MCLKKKKKTAKKTNKFNDETKHSMQTVSP